MIGIIMLNTRFPRIEGDIGNPSTFPGPVLYERVDQALIGKVISSGPLHEDISMAFVGAARKLEGSGATTIGTSCGFLASEQSKLQSAVSCPVLSSSLVLIPFLKRLFSPTLRIGVLTFDADQLSVRHFGENFNNNVVVQGLPKAGTLYRTILNDEATLDISQAKGEVTSMAQTLLSQTPDVNILLLECTNLSPFKQELREECQLPVFDLVDALIWLDKASL
ncbi:MAG: aspartate/glutamate racemase family protein [Arenicellales bacterium]|nr:aspartate/glutamate racemase family protein [Arenicellales bacterium]